MTNLEKQIDFLLERLLLEIPTFSLLSEEVLVSRICKELIGGLVDFTNSSGPEALKLSIELSASCLYLLAKKRIEDRTSRSSFAE
jgi:hypothetical protein